MEANNDEIMSFLSEPRTLAIVGASTNPKKAGNYVPRFLMDRGFSVIPINPFADELFGKDPLDDLTELDEEVDGVIIYRGGDAATKEVMKAVNMDIPWIWLPEGVTSEEGKAAAKDQHYVEDKCPKALIEKWIKSGEMQG